MQTRHAHAELFPTERSCAQRKGTSVRQRRRGPVSAREAAVDPYQAIEAILPWTTFVAEAEQLARPTRFDPLALLATAFPRARRDAPTLLDSFEFTERARVNRCSTG
jgi:hypothetical protein